MSLTVRLGFAENPPETGCACGDEHEQERVASALYDDGPGGYRSDGNKPNGQERHESFHALIMTEGRVDG